MSSHLVPVGGGLFLDLSRVPSSRFYRKERERRVVVLRVPLPR